MTIFENVDTFYTQDTIRIDLNLRFEAVRERDSYFVDIVVGCRCKEVCARDTFRSVRQGLEPRFLNIVLTERA